MTVGSANRPTVLVVGNGMVGHRFVEAAVEAGLHTSHQIVVVGEEHRRAYDRVHLSSVFDGVDPDDLALGSSDLYEHDGVELVLGEVVTVPTVKPAPVSDVVAAAWLRPTTFGTVTGGLPLETTRFIAVPTSTVRPSAGFWLITTPAGTVVLLCCVITPMVIPCSRMMLSAVCGVFTSPSGTPTSNGVIVPSEITRSTREPAGSVKPERGSVETTRPIGIVGLLTVVTLPGSRPAFRIAVFAAACVRPMTFGTVLSGLVRRIHREATVRSFGSPDDLAVVEPLIHV